MTRIITAPVELTFNAFDSKLSFKHPLKIMDSLLTSNELFEIVLFTPQLSVIFESVKLFEAIVTSETFCNTIFASLKSNPVIIDLSDPLDKIKIDLKSFK